MPGKYLQELRELFGMTPPDRSRDPAKVPSLIERQEIKDIENFKREHEKFLLRERRKKLRKNLLTTEEQDMSELE